MNDAELNPRTAISHFFNKKLTATQLLRSLAVYRGWQIPARLESLMPAFNTFKLGEGATHLFLFSDKDAYMQCRDKIGIATIGDFYIGNISGHKAFADIAEGVTVVNVNPYSDEEVHYTVEQIPLLRMWSQIIQTEMALDTVSTVKTGYTALRSFAGYYFIMEDEQYVVLAPDGRGRKLAALFTADDALDLFLERNGKPNMRPVPIAGEALFAAIRKMPLEGMVFNCSGPAKPRVLPLSFADDVLSNRE